MLPQFGYIVAQAGADYYSLPSSSPSISTNHHPLAPLLNKNNTSNVILPPPSTFLQKKDIWYKPTPFKEQEDHTWQDTLKQKEYNDLMTYLDNEFWEQADESYKEKLTKLENELYLIQSGTHSVFKDMLSDCEFKRNEIIQEAELFMDYQISFIEHFYQENIHSIQDEYELEKKNLLEEMKRQLKEEEEQQEEDSHRKKRNLRKRNADTGNTLKSEPLAKRRSVRPSTPHSFTTISSLEEEQLENDFLLMKKSTLY